jgi:putative ATP-dependent endonuclease of OLD family
LRSGEDGEGPPIEREIRDYLSATYLRPLRDAEAELSAGRGSRLAQILSSSKALRQDENFEKLLSDFIQANVNAKANPGVSASQQSILKHFQKMTFADDKERFRVAVQILGSKALSEMSGPEKQRAFQDILSRLSLVLDEFRPQQGLGYNNVLFMATELILLEQEAGQCPLLLIEEPEAHLHPQLQMKFLKFVRDEFSQGDAPKLQTILTTHSPNLASKAPLDSLIVMKDGKAFPMCKEATKLDPADYEFLEKFLDVTKANLFFAKAVLIVEGDGENILLPTVAELLGRPLENHGVSIVNVGSTAYARYAKIFPRPGIDEKPEGWLPIKVACLRDLDLWPEAADKDANQGIGFKTVKDGNKPYWVRRQGPDGSFGTDPDEKRRKLERFLSIEDEEAAFEPQNVKVCVSEEWTFEYCLARSGLAPLVYEAAHGSSEGFEKLSDDAEMRAVQIYKNMETKSGAKTDVAYKLTGILEREYGPTGKREELKENLPSYVLDALAHVTGSWPENLDAEGDAEPEAEANERDQAKSATVAVAEVTGTNTPNGQP